MTVASTSVVETRAFSLASAFFASISGRSRRALRIRSSRSRAARSRAGSVLNLLLIELFLKQIKWLEAHTNIVETLPFITTQSNKINFSGKILELDIENC